MTIAETYNGHRIYNTIIWQYEKSPRIVGWVQALSKFGYETCGRIFDDMLYGLIGGMETVTDIAKYSIQALTGSLGFDWSMVSDIQKAIAAIFKTKFLGTGVVSEWDELSDAFGFTYSCDELSWGGLVSFSLSTEDGIKSLFDMGLQIPMSVNERINATFSPAFTFSDSNFYVSDKIPRAASDLERTFPEYGGEGKQGWTLEDVCDGSIWSEQ